MMRGEYLPRSQLSSISCSQPSGQFEQVQIQKRHSRCIWNKKNVPLCQQSILLCRKMCALIFNRKTIIHTQSYVEKGTVEPTSQKNVIPVHVMRMIIMKLISVFSRHKASIVCMNCELNWITVLEFSQMITNMVNNNSILSKKQHTMIQFSRFFFFERVALSILFRTYLCPSITSSDLHTHSTRIMNCRDWEKKVVKEN